MDFEFSDDQRAFREVMRDFADERIAPVAREWEQSGRTPTEIVDGLAELGLFGMLVPEQYGGLDLDAVSYGIVFEEISRAWMGIAGFLGTHSLATNLIARHGTPEQRDRHLPAMATGERRSALGLTEPGAGSDLQGITTRAVHDGDHYVVNGVKTWLTNANIADPLTVLCVTDPAAEPRHRGISLLLIDADSPGVEVGRDIPKLGYKGTESNEVVLSDVHVPVDNLLGGIEGRGFKQAVAALEIGRVNIAARSVGLGQASFDAAMRYAQQREAFGKHIADFQAIQLKLADMATEIQAGRLLWWWAAAAIDAGQRSDLKTGMAKLYCSEMALRASLTALRIHGGYGFSREFEVERYYRDAPLMAIGEGTSDILRLVIARRLLAGDPLL